MSIDIDQLNRDLPDHQLLDGEDSPDPNEVLVQFPYGYAQIGGSRRGRELRGALLMAMDAWLRTRKDYVGEAERLIRWCLSEAAEAPVRRFDELPGADTASLDKSPCSGAEEAL